MRPSRIGVVLVGTLLVAATCPAQSPQSARGPATGRPESTLIEALQANPITAPYRFVAEAAGGRVALRGRVPSKGVHDTAVRTAIGMGMAIRDDLVIDSTVAPSNSGTPAQPQSIVSSYTYPPPLFGRYDEPFFGLEPPLASFPPYGGSLTQARIAQAAPPVRTQAVESPVVPGTVDVAIDPTGVALLRGTVATVDERLGIEGRVGQIQGVTRIINQVNIDPNVGGARTDNGPVGRNPFNDQPPPPPTPSNVRPRSVPAEPGGAAIQPAPSGPTPTPTPVSTLGPSASAAAERSLLSVPELAGTGAKVTVRDGVASLSGSVPSVYEAMLAFRAIQQTPGVSEVFDSLRFPVPDGQAKNPLLTRAGVDDVEPYLTTQVRRQVGGAAHLDRVRVEGETLRVVGTIQAADDRPRVEAILRSMAILRGYKISPEFRVLDR